jgi:hypothetical protein
MFPPTISFSTINYHFTECFNLIYQLGKGVVYVKSRDKAIPVTSRGGLYGCQMSRLLHFLDYRLP